MCISAGQPVQPGAPQSLPRALQRIPLLLCLQPTCLPLTACALGLFFPHYVYLSEHLGKEKGAAFAKLDNWPSSLLPDWLEEAL